MKNNIPCEYKKLKMPTVFAQDNTKLELNTRCEYLKDVGKYHRKG